MRDINANVSGTYCFLWFKKDYSKEQKISTENFLEFQRREINEKTNANNPVGIIESQNKTYTFNDQDSINESLWMYADTNKDDLIDENEYNMFLARSISNGIVGDIDARYNSEMNYSLNGQGFIFAGGTQKTIGADYEQLAELLNLYNEIKNIDSNIDLNGDKLLDKDEFNNSILTKLLTSDEGKELINKNSASQEDILLAESLSDGPIAEVETIAVPKLKTGVRMDGKGVTTTTVMATETRISSDYDTLIDVAEKYREAKR